MTTDQTDRALWRLSGWINYRLDQIHDEALENLRWMARSVGQRTRTDRL